MINTMNAGDIIEGVVDLLASCLSDNSDGNKNPWPKIIIAAIILIITIGLAVYFN